jgi:hypothetical protein
MIEEHNSTILNELDWSRIRHMCHKITIHDHDKEQEDLEKVTHLFAIIANLSAYGNILTLFIYIIIDETHDQLIKNQVLTDILLPTLNCTNIQVIPEAKDRVRINPIRECDYERPSHYRNRASNKYVAYFKQRRRIEKRTALKTEREWVYRTDTAELDLGALRDRFYPLLMHCVRALNNLASNSMCFNYDITRFIDRFAKYFVQFDVLSSLISLLEYTNNQDLIKYLIDAQNNPSRLSFMNTINKLKRRKHKNKYEQRIEKDVIEILTSLALHASKHFCSIMWGSQDRLVKPLVALTMASTRQTTLSLGIIWHHLLSNTNKSAFGEMHEQWERIVALSSTSAGVMLREGARWVGVNPFAVMVMPKKIKEEEE